MGGSQQGAGGGSGQLGGIQNRPSGVDPISPGNLSGPGGPNLAAGGGLLNGGYGIQHPNLPIAQPTSGPSTSGLPNGGYGVQTPNFATGGLSPVAPGVPPGQTTNPLGTGGLNPGGGFQGPGSGGVGGGQGKGGGQGGGQGGGGGGSGAQGGQSLIGGGIQTPYWQQQYQQNPSNVQAYYSPPAANQLSQFFPGLSIFPGGGSGGGGKGGPSAGPGGNIGGGGQINPFQGYNNIPGGNLI